MFFFIIIIMTNKIAGCNKILSSIYKVTITGPNIKPVFFYPKVNVT